MKNTIEASIASRAGKLLRDNFGKGPESLFVSVSKPYVTIYLKRFLAPMEQVLLKQRNSQKVQETRDLLMNELLPDFKFLLSTELGAEVEKVFYDWNLDNQSGIIFAELDSDYDETADPSFTYDAMDEVHKEIERFTRKAQKTPANIRSFMLNDRTLVSKRSDILVLIEKEMINAGFSESLRLAKRKLEKTLIDQNFLESVLGKQIENVFVDWDFDTDKGYVIFILKPKRKQAGMSGQ